MKLSVPARQKARRRHNLNLEIGSDFYPETDSDGDGLNAKSLDSISGEIVMTLIVRADLKMSKGKVAAQCLHATLCLYGKMANPIGAAYNPDMIKRWNQHLGQAKVILQVPDQEAMDIMFAQAMSMGINAYIVHDAGKTQIAAGSATVLGLGPAPKLDINQITLQLRLY